MAKSELKFDRQDFNGVILIRISGPLDSLTYDQFRAYIDPLVQRPNTRVVLDCQNLTYLNSRGVALLAHYYRTSNLALTFFGIAGLPPRVIKMLQSLHLDRLLKWYPTVDHAMQMAAAV